MTNFLLQRYPAFGFPRYRKYWLASLASVGATQLITLAQGWLVFELSGSALQLGILGAAVAAPNIAMTLIGGVFADRFDKRLILVWTSGAIATLLALLAWLDYSGTVRVWHVLAVAAAVSLITGLDWPARVSIFPQLIDRPAFMSAVALNSIIWQATRMAMPALGGIIIAASDTWVLFALGSGGFLTMMIVISGLHVTTSDARHGSPLEQIAEGVRFIVNEELFKWLMLLTFIGMFFAGSYVQIMPVFADVLESGEAGYGYLLSAGGVGAVAGTLLVGGVQEHARLGFVMLGGATLSAALTAVFALVAVGGWFIAALLATFFASVFTSVFMISSMAVLQLVVPDDLRGRVMGIHAIGYSLIPLGGLFMGALAEAAGPALAVLIGCCVFGFAIAGVAMTSTTIRGLDGRLIGHKQA
ncbi:MAG TPA: MFS transporter [Pseudomonadales bacterium]|jgi:MFS family permease